MKVTILGCGGSSGVPVIGIGWGDCDPNNPKNRRRRVSILVDDGETSVMIDSAPEMREQLTDIDCRHLDAVVFTHEHADHTHGLNDLRNMAAVMSRRIDVYGDMRTLDSLTTRFSYAFQQPHGSLYRAFLEAHVISGPFDVGSLHIVPFEQDHGQESGSLGFRIGNVAYSTDLIGLSDDAFDVLDGVDTWIVDCQQYTPHPTHAHFDLTLSWIERLKPRRAVLTHMSHKLDYDELKSRCPAGVEPAYDGMIVDIA